MYYNRSCRACGSVLEPTLVCDICTEYISWICCKCFRTDEVIHKHNILPDYSCVITSYPQLKTKDKEDNVLLPIITEG
jgi:hypothetical protein